MFGVHLPVAAYDYGPCLRELVQPGVNGMLFRTPADLSAQLETVCADVRAGGAMLDRLRAGTRESAGVRWSEGWRLEARDRLLGAEPAT